MSSTNTKPRKSKLNVHLLRRVKRHILDEPKRFLMHGIRLDGIPGNKFISDNNSDQKFPSCGTVACIAGWTLILGGKQCTGNLSDLDKAARLLNLGHDQEDPLFLQCDWPEKFRERYNRMKTPAARANIAAARIEHLITTGE